MLPDPRPLTQDGIHRVGIARRRYPSFPPNRVIQPVDTGSLFGKD